MQFRCSEFISFYENLPRPAHAPYLRPVGKKETEPKRLFAIHGTAKYRSSCTFKFRPYYREIPAQFSKLTAAQIRHPWLNLALRDILSLHSSI
jgi:hypothetical protein